MGGAHSSENRTGKRSVGRLPTRWTDDIKRVAGSRWKQAAQDRDFGTLYKRPLSRSGLQSVEVMMMMMKVYSLYYHGFTRREKERERERVYVTF
ncbi:jg8503 [Pararge aegeria aegeria]|uniref:Jg8503 protein n=1 Tax=Pararge aegeria aegeria TaxID=348720 RepID=A0A8S4RBT2_9NEOP|nr:jg8503 [Pararge aegeria aegeria]